MIEREIRLESAGTTYVLSPTLGALRSICQRWAKMEDAINDLRGLNFDACTLIVAAATGLTAEKAAQVVFAAGLAKSTAACVDLLAFMINPGGEEQESASTGNP